MQSIHILSYYEPMSFVLFLEDDNIQAHEDGLAPYAGHMPPNRSTALWAYPVQQSLPPKLQPHNKPKARHVFRVYGQPIPGML